VSAMVCTSNWSAVARGLVCSGARSWRDWDPRADWVSSAAGGMHHICYVCVYKDTHIYMYTLVHTHIWIAKGGTG